MRLRPLLTAAAILVFAGVLGAKDDVRLKDALQDDLVSADWIYDDIERGNTLARKTGKPLLVSFRCVP